MVVLEVMKVDSDSLSWTGECNGQPRQLYSTEHSSYLELSSFERLEHLYRQ